MRKKLQAPVQVIKTYNQYRWFRWLWRSFAFFIVLIILSYVGMAWYINHNKSALLKTLTENLSAGLNGTVTIGDMEPAFLVGFPQVSLRLRKVVVRDSRYEIHKRTLLNAEDFNISVNALALIRGNIDINRLLISDAEVNIYTDSLGYSNTDIFPKKEANQKSSKSFPLLKRFALNNVRVKIDNVLKKKLFNFVVKDLTGKLKYSNTGWVATADLDTQVKSMAFSTSKGSFALNKNIAGRLKGEYLSEKGIITISPADLKIGEDDFVVSANFGSPTNPDYFAIRIRANKILWRHASALLSPNISSRLNLFELSQPIKVGCDIIGDFSLEGDPVITVRADVKNNQLHTIGGSFNKCNFTGYFTNNFDKKLGINDINSTITFRNFSADYSGIPIKISRAYIHDLENPIAKGDFSSDFDVSKLNNIIDKNLLGFTAGKASVDLNFVADIINYEISKPQFDGTITIKNAALQYLPRKLKFKNVDVSMLFQDGNLVIPKLNVQSGKSTVMMNGHVDNFLNLYYSNPERIVLKWHIKSTHLQLSEFMGFIGSRQKTNTVVKKRGDFTNDLDILFDKSNVDMDLDVAKIIYNRFTATNLKSNIILSQNGIFVKNGFVNHADGSIKFEGSMEPNAKTNDFKISTKVNDVNIKKFFESFNNFSLQSLKSSNIQGKANITANLSGLILDNGTLLENSLRGNVDFHLKEAAIIKFDPIRNAAKYAFPFRDFNTISIDDLKGSFIVDGEKVQIKPTKINSSVINMNVEGVYSFGAGTLLYINIPLRNPKKDENIDDKEELANRRMRGIVVNLIAKDDTDGKIKISIGKKDD